MSQASVAALGRVKVIAQPSTSAPNNSVAAKAFGGGATSSGTPSGRSVLHPGRAFGMKFWLGVGAIVGMAWIYHHLPE